MIQYPNKEKVNIKTFIETSPEKIDKEVNEFRNSHKATATLTNVIIDNKDTIYYVYIVFYIKE